jgi:hypothetical protein
MSLFATTSGQRVISVDSGTKKKSANVAKSSADSSSDDDSESDMDPPQSENCLKIWKYEF